MAPEYITISFAAQANLATIYLNTAAKIPLFVCKKTWCPIIPHSSDINGYPSCGESQYP